MVQSSDSAGHQPTMIEQMYDTNIKNRPLTYIGKRKKKDSKGDVTDETEICGEADSVELCGAFKDAEGGPPTPLAEPLPQELCDAMNMTCTSASSRRQIRGMLSMLRREGRLPAGEDSDELDGREAEVDSMPAEFAGIKEELKELLKLQFTEEVWARNRINFEREFGQRSGVTTCTLVPPTKKIAKVRK